jgi:F-type H+-transporting ATPase subunit a
MIPVAPETLFMLGFLPVTNTLLTGWIVVVLLTLLCVVISRSIREVPGGIQNVAEALLENMLEFMDQVTHDRARSRKFLPIVGALFPFILFSNWMGLLPGVGTIGIWQVTAAGKELIPFIRPVTSDPNMTFAMSIATVVISHVLGMMAIGIFKYWGKFIQVAPLWKAVTSIGKVPAGRYATDVFTAVIGIGVGLIELMSEVAKMISLALRLFGNIFAGEVLIHVLSSLIPFVLPTPFMFLELIVGVVQALVFSMLTLVYLTLATDAPHGDEHAHEEDKFDEAHGIAGTAPEPNAGVPL